eukprot:CAMPEP_0202902112 /NCGR_PEP_ID=MMETSP1392-20130828/16444_1 /ASSEMBLY_ACC=CAM_ASM_000868 /TAXON_ID=225041 /ORGANISM="Chlamydomonas chlamydogama, Strain SAG 11-48b" /LENGTH=90 /DNA_ID=CAMNT_0049588825 /DNA_START=7 /DNA_END=279 /DNA_ORIENTATION=-
MPYAPQLWVTKSSPTTLPPGKLIGEMSPRLPVPPNVTYLKVGASGLRVLWNQEVAVNWPHMEPHRPSLRAMILLKGCAGRRWVLVLKGKS